MGIRSDLDANFDYEIVDEFLDHYSMMVDSMEVMIIDLSKPNMYKRSTDELFRVFHLRLGMMILNLTMSLLT